MCAFSLVFSLAAATLNAVADAAGAPVGSEVDKGATAGAAVARQQEPQSQLITPAQGWGVVALTRNNHTHATAGLAAKLAEEPAGPVLLHAFSEADVTDAVTCFALIHALGLSDFAH